MSASRKALFVDPMFCLFSSSLPEGRKWEQKFKLDGYRAVAIRVPGSKHQWGGFLKP
jgi:hypothetical protein